MALSFVIFDNLFLYFSVSDFPIYVTDFATIDSEIYLKQRKQVCNCTTVSLLEPDSSALFAFVVSACSCNVGAGGWPVMINVSRQNIVPAQVFSNQGASILE